MSSDDRSPRSLDADARVLEVVDIAIRDGDLEHASWVYAWLDDTEPPGVVYVGATWLPPSARTFLHLHDPDPSVGRIRTEHPELLDGRATVRAFRIAPELDRHSVRSAVVGLLQGDDVADATAEGRAARTIVSLLRDPQR